MAKEKFVRSKPHVNFLDGIKEKLGLAPKEPEEPPIEPLDAADEAPDAGGSMLLPRVGWEAGVLDESSGPGGAADHQPGSLAPNGGAEEAMFNPKELTVDKSVPWKQAEDDAFKVASGEDGSSHVEFGDGAQGEVPPTGEEVQSEYQHSGGDAGQNDSRFMKSRSGHQMDDDEDNEAMGAEEGSNAGIQHDHVYQHNQTDLAFLEQSAQAAGDADVKEGGQNSFVHQLPTHDDDADSLAAEASDEAAGKVWMPSNFKLEVGGLDEGAGAPESFFLPETDDEVIVAFEQGDQNAPVVVGSMWNGQDVPPTSEAGDADELAAPETDADAASQPTFDPLTTFAFSLQIDADESGDSTLAGEFKVSESMVPLDAGEEPDVAGLDVDGLDADLDD